MAIDRNSKLYGEQSPVTLLEKRKGQAEVKELYDKIYGLEKSLADIASSLQVVKEVSSTIDNSINNIISNSSFTFSHRVYSMATFYNSYYMLAKWYTRESGYTTSWIKNTDNTESSHSIRSIHGYPPDRDSVTWAFPGYQVNYGPPAWLYDWRFGINQDASVSKLQIESTDPTNTTLKVVTEGFGISVGQTIRVKDSSIVLPLPSNVSGLTMGKTYWIADVTTVSGTKYIKLSDSPIPVAPNVPSYVPVFKSGAADAFIYAFIYVTPSAGSVWDVRSGTLRMTGGYTAATHLSEKKLKIGERAFFQCRLTHIPHMVAVGFNSTTNSVLSEAHNFVDNTKIIFYSPSNTLPTGLDSSTSYYVVSSLANEFKISTTLGGAPIELVDEGSGEILARSIMADDLTMRLSIWDNANNKIIRGDRPVLSVAKIGTHEIEAQVSGKTYRFGPSSGMDVYAWSNTSKAFASQTNYIIPPPPENYAPLNSIVRVADSGDGMPASLSPDRYYYLGFDGVSMDGGFYLKEMVSGSKISLNSDSFNGKQLEFYMYESLVIKSYTRRYILEVLLPEDRKLYSDPNVFSVGQNQIDETINPAEVDSQNVVTISWPDVPNAVAYNLYRDTDKSGNFKFIGSSEPGGTTFIDYGGNAEISLPAIDSNDEYNQLYTAEIRLPNVTKTISEIPGFSVRVTTSLVMPSVISDITTLGDQFFQIEFLKSDGTPATKADLPNYSISLDEIGLSFLGGSWSPSAADTALKPIPIIPRAAIVRGGGQAYTFGVDPFGSTWEPGGQTRVGGLWQWTSSSTLNRWGTPVFREILTDYGKVFFGLLAYSYQEYLERWGGIN